MYLSNKYRLYIQSLIYIIPLCHNDQLFNFNVQQEGVMFTKYQLLREKPGSLASKCSIMFTS